MSDNGETTRQDQDETPFLDPSRRLQTQVHDHSSHVSREHDPQMGGDPRTSHSGSTGTQDPFVLMVSILERLTSQTTLPNDRESLGGGAEYGGKVKKFRTMEKGEDLVIFLETFETFMGNYEVVKTKWVRKLLPLLNSVTMAAFNKLPEESKADYDRVKEGLFVHFQISRDTYRRRYQAII